MRPRRSGPFAAAGRPARPATGLSLGRLAYRAALVLLACGAAPVALRAQTVPPGLVPPSPAPGGFVHDGGPVLSAAERDALNAHIAAVQRATGGDVAVLILRDLRGRAPVDVAVAAYRAWGVGRADSLGSARRDLGALLLLVPKELAPDGRGRCWISTGLGAEGPLTDAAAGAICRDAVVPALRARHYAAAADSGVARLGAAFAEATAGLPAPAAVGGAAAPAVAPALMPMAAPDDGGFGAGTVVLLGIAGLGGAAGAAVLVGRARRRRPRRCPNGHGRMTRLDEQAEDAALASGQQAEERVGSVDYDVWACAACDARTVVAYPKRFGGHGRFAACPRCRARTVSTHTRTLHAATTASTGVEETTARCLHCGWRDVTRRVLPLVVVATSTSGTSGGWGGSAGGGGGGSGGGGSSSHFGGSGATAGGGGGSDY